MSSGYAQGVGVKAYAQSAYLRLFDGINLSTSAAADAKRIIFEAAAEQNKVTGALSGPELVEKVLEIQRSRDQRLRKLLSGPDVATFDARAVSAVMPPPKLR